MKLFECSVNFFGNIIQNIKIVDQHIITVARRDWVYVHIPTELAKRLDNFLDLPKGKRLGISNKSELLRYIINKFLQKNNNGK